MVLSNVYQNAAPRVVAQGRHSMYRIAVLPPISLFALVGIHALPLLTATRRFGYGVQILAEFHEPIVDLLLIYAPKVP